MAVLAYRGVRRTTYGYRFVYRGQLYKKVVGPSKALAKAAEEAERRRLAGLAFEARWGPRTPPLTSWADALERYELAKAGKGSLRLDLTRLRWWAAFLRGEGYHYLQVVPPEALDRAKVALSAQGRAPLTIRHYLATLRHLYELAIRRWRVSTANPVHAVDFPKPVTVQPTLPTTPQLKTLLQVAEPSVRLLIVGALLTGLRQGALLGLTREDLKVVPGWLRCRDQKGGKEYWIPAARPLSQLHPRAGQGNLWNVGRFPAKAWRRSRKAAGLPTLRFHDLRGVFSTTLAEAGVSHDVIRRMLGHGPRDVTDLYVRPRDPALVEAIQRLEGMYRSLNLSRFKLLKTRARSVVS